MKRAAAQLNPGRESGFSLLELLIAMTLTMIVMGAAARLLTTSLHSRTRENQRSESLADAQRALTIMSREIANAGYGLVNPVQSGLQDTGIVPANSGSTAIRIRANVNNINTNTNDADEDITYSVSNNAIIRTDRAAPASPLVLASRIDQMSINYYDAASATPLVVNATNMAAATAASVARVRISILVNLPASVGQPASQVQISSDVILRNSPPVLRRY